MRDSVLQFKNHNTNMNRSSQSRLFVGAKRNPETNAMHVNKEFTASDENNDRED